MKHQKEWYTCDRCGAEIKYIPKKLMNSIFYCCQKLIKISTKTADEIDAIVATEIQKVEDGSKVLAMDISYTYRDNITELNLCPKCRKDFERFMKGEI